MSVAAMTWAFRQKVPPAPKIVLLALADQTDEVTGRVCYGKSDIAHLADKCSVSPRSMVRVIGALVRNGYIRRESGKDRGSSNTYWLILDRERAESLDEWQSFGEPRPDPEPPDGGADHNPDTLPDVGGGYANLAQPESETIPVDNERGYASVGVGGYATGGAPRDSIDNQVKTHLARPCGKPGSGFSRKAQERAIETEAISRAAETQNIRYFVLQGSTAWEAWCRYRMRHGQVGSMPTCLGQGQFANKRGWYLPSLFPPKAKPEATADPAIRPDDDEFMRENGLG